ncbi:MAG: zf-TFIIB domain-containing protein [Gorillibacterium sp.]|nr:zf-TFIIB domain-containing protein [Gorillibacterium sp.]
MICPICDNVQLREVEKGEILIDVCPSCKGVWLDRGELEKIMQGVREVRPSFNQWYEDKDEDDEDKRKHQSYDSSPSASREGFPPSTPYSKNEYPQKKKKKSVMDILGDLFE